MSNNELTNYMTAEQIDKILSWSKWAWGLLVGTFLLGAAANYQMLSAKFENEKRDHRITTLEEGCADYWTTLNMKHLYANIEFWTNHVDKGTSYRNAIIDEVKRK
jgi:hypothetical protein